ncbi:melanopsin-like [Arapaima gigas]
MPRSRCLVKIKEASDIETRLNEVERLLKNVINMPWKYSRSEVVLTFFERSPLDQVLKNDNIHKIQPCFQSPVKISEIMRSNGFCLANTETIVFDENLPQDKERPPSIDSAEHPFENSEEFLTTEPDNSDDDPEAYVTNLSYYHLVPFETDILDKYCVEKVGPNFKKSSNMSHHSARMDVSCHHGEPNCTRIFKNAVSSRSFRLMDLPFHRPTHASHLEHPHSLPTVNVPDHVHYIIGSVILAVGITGVVGNALVIYVFCRSRTLRTPGNIFVVNLAVADFLMSLTQAPIFFVASLHRRWVFGEHACELYAFCGGLFGICSMMTLTAIAADRCLAITRPLAVLGRVNRHRVGAILGVLWVYSLGWSLPPFFGWSAYVPEGLQTSCSWDYMSFTASVRTYTVLLFIFVFFIPLTIIGSCYLAIFRTIRAARREVLELDCGESQKAYERMRSEWKMAKVALLVILLFVISWSPYSVVALTATAGYSHLLTPYMNSVPAVIAKASAIHNPIIYAITHPKYRMAIAQYVPLLRPLLRVKPNALHSSLSSVSSTSSHRSTLTSQCSLGIMAHANPRWGRTRLSSASDTEFCWTETTADGSSFNSVSFVRQASTEISTDTAIPASQPPTSEHARAHKVATFSNMSEAELPEGGNQPEGKADLLPSN